MLNQKAKRDRRDHPGDAEAGVHHACSGPRKAARDIDGQRPEHGISELETEKRQREIHHGGRWTNSDNRRQNENHRSDQPDQQQRATGNS